MTLPLLLGTLLVGAAVVVAVRQGLSSRKSAGPVGLGVKAPTKK